MKRLLGLIGALLVCLFATSVHAANYSISINPKSPPPSGSTYYITTSGNDANDGKSIGTAWATPNHPLSCGDAILVQPGLYGGNHFQAKPSVWPIVANCPSPTGLNFVIVECNRTYLQDCTIDGTHGRGDGSAISVTTSNWAIIGFTTTANCGNGSCFGYCLAGGSGHHVVFINNYAHDCVWSGASISGDYQAYIGLILYHNAYANWPTGFNCPSNISIINNIPRDSAPGTHIYLAGLFSLMAGANAGCWDGHGLIFDNMDAHSFSTQVALEQSMFLGNSISGIHNFKPSSGTTYENHLTIYGNGASQHSPGPISDFDQWGGPSIQANSIIIQANTATQRNVTCSASPDPCPDRYAIGFTWTVSTINNSDYIGVGGRNCWNYRDVVHQACGQASGYPESLGSNNVSVDPQWVNANAVPSSAPDCSHAATVVDCMTSVIAGFTPQNSAVAGMGYQRPGPCAPDPYWPIWVPVSLIPDGIVTKPCC